MASKVFITATDTDAGKTWVTASAIRSLNPASSLALKPLACGINKCGSFEDVDALLAAQNISDADHISLYRLALAAAPSQAARAEKVAIDPDQLVAWCNSKAATVDTCLIEGVGGLMVPITDSWLVSDWIKAMPEHEVWLVVGCRLGAINQALLTLDKLKQIGRSPSHIFFNAPNPECGRWVEPTRQAVTPFLDPNTAVHTLSFGEAATLGFKPFLPR